MEGETMASFKIKNGLDTTTLINTTTTVTPVTQNGLAAPSLTGNDLNTSMSLANQYGFKFKPDGTKFYHFDNDTTNRVAQYDLSTAFDLSTASAVSYSLATQRNVKGLAFSSDGTNFYLVRDYANNVVLQYDVTTAWDTTSGLTLGDTLDVTAQLPTSLYSIYFNSAGTRMVVVGGAEMADYTLSTAWDITTATAVNTISGTDPSTTFSEDGLEAFYISTDKGIYKATLTSAFDLSTLSAFTFQGYVPSGLSDAKVFYKIDDTTGVILDYVSLSSDFVEVDTIYQEYTLDLSEANSFSFTTTTGSAVSIVNPPPTGNISSFSLEVDNTNDVAITFGDIKWHGNDTPAVSSGVDLFGFIATSDGTYYGRKLGSDFQ